MKNNGNETFLLDVYTFIIKQKITFKNKKVYTFTNKKSLYFYKQKKKH